MIPRLVLATATVVVVLLTGHPAHAQNGAPAVDVFAGYSLLPSNFDDDFPRRTSHGIQGSAAFHFTSWFAAVVDSGVQWNTTKDLGPNFAGLTARTRVHELLVGPRFTARSPRADGFVHGWIGTAAGSTNEEFRGFGDRGLTFGGGGGVDLHVSSRTSIRVQYDLVGSFADVVEGNSRFATGLVWRFGQR